MAEHLATMTHIDVDVDIKNELGTSEKMVRLSIGVAHHEYIIFDLSQAFEQA